MSIKIGVVGASIAGVASSIELKKLGFNVTLFEESKSISYQRGAGLMMPITLINSLKQRGLVGDSLKYFTMNEFTTFLKKDDGGQRVLTKTDYHDSVTVHWGNLHAGLDEKFDRIMCLFGKEISEVNNHE